MKLTFDIQYMNESKAFGVAAHNRRDVQEMHKDFQKTFYSEVCKTFETYGLEAMSEQTGTHGKKSQAFFIQEQNNEIKKEIERLTGLQKDLKNKVNKMLVYYKALTKVVDPKKGNELMQDLKKEKTLQQNKLEQFKKERER